LTDSGPFLTPGYVHNEILAILKNDNTEPEILKNDNTEPERN